MAGETYTQEPIVQKMSQEVQLFEKLNFTNVMILFRENNDATIHYSKTRTALILLYYTCTVF